MPLWLKEVLTGLFILAISFAVAGTVAFLLNLIRSRISQKDV